MNHSHKKRKDSLEIQAAFNWIFILTWNFGGGWSDSAFNFFENSKRKLILMRLNYNWLFHMLDNDNIISTSVLVAVEKIPKDEKVYRKCFFIVFYFAQPQHTKSRPTCTIANSRNSCLPTRMHMSNSLINTSAAIFWTRSSIKLMFIDDLNMPKDDLNIHVFL